MTIESLKSFLINELYSLEIFDTCSNTIDLAINTYKARNNNIIIASLGQEFGRGRQGRIWNSPSGNYYISALFNGNFSNHESLIINFAFTLSVRRVIEKLIPKEKVLIKWPNDIFVNFKKLAGILITKKDNSFILISAGININSDPIVTNSAILKSFTSKIPSIETIIKEILNEFVYYIDIYINLGSEELFRLLSNKSIYKNGDKIAITGLKESYIFKEIDSSGALVAYDSDNNLHKFSSAEIIENNKY